MLAKLYDAQCCHSGCIAHLLPNEGLRVLLVNVDLDGIVVVTIATAGDDAELAGLGEVYAVRSVIVRHGSLVFTDEESTAVVVGCYRTYHATDIAAYGQRVCVVDGACHLVDMESVCAAGNGALHAIDYALHVAQRKRTDGSIIIERYRRVVRLGACCQA